MVGQKLFLCRVGRGFAPLALPVLIPRVKKRPSPRDPRGVVRETTPSNANKRRCRAGRVRLCPLPTFSGRFRGSLPAFAGEATCGRSCGGAGRDDAEAGTLKVPRRTDQQTASSSRGGLRPLRGVAARALDRYAVCAATLAYRLGAFRTALAPAYGGSLRSADSRVR